MLIQWKNKDRSRVNKVLITMPKSEWFGILTIMLLLIETKNELLIITTALFFITGLFKYKKTNAIMDLLTGLFK